MAVDLIESLNHFVAKLILMRVTNSFAASRPATAAAPHRRTSRIRQRAREQLTGDCRHLLREFG